MQEKESFGAEVNPTGEPIGGGKGYRRLVTQMDYRVETLAELLTALKEAKPDQVVYVDDNVEMDMTGERKIEIPSGVTLASGRGKEGSRGALLYSNELDTSPLFLTGGEKVRVTGLRLCGPDPERRTDQMRQLHSEGAVLQHPQLQWDTIHAPSPGSG